MPVTEEQIHKAIHRICHEVDANERKALAIKGINRPKVPISFRLLRKSPGFPRLANYLWFEINHWPLRNPDNFYGHLSKRNLIFVFSEILGWKYDVPLGVLEGLVRFLSEAQKQEDQLAEAKRPRVNTLPRLMSLDVS